MFARWAAFRDLRRLPDRNHYPAQLALVMSTLPARRFHDLPACCCISYKKIPIGTFALLARLPSDMIHVLWRTMRDEVDVMPLAEAEQHFDLI